MFERAAAAESESLGPILTETMTPQMVPDEGQWDALAWNELVEDTATRDRVVSVLPADPGPAPGVLWTRIRA